MKHGTRIRLVGEPEREGFLRWFSTDSLCDLRLDDYGDVRRWPGEFEAVAPLESYVGKKVIWSSDSDPATRVRLVIGVLAGPQQLVLESTVKGALVTAGWGEFSV